MHSSHLVSYLVDMTHKWWRRLYSRCTLLPQAHEALQLTQKTQDGAATIPNDGGNSPHASAAVEEQPHVHIHPLPRAQTHCALTQPFRGGSKMSLNCLFGGRNINQFDLCCPPKNQLLNCSQSSGGCKEERNRGEKDNIMEGQGVGLHVSDESSPSLFFFFTMVSNGVDTLRLPSCFKVRVMRRACPLSKFFLYDGFTWCRYMAVL